MLRAEIGRPACPLSCLGRLIGFDLYFAAPSFPDAFNR
jgi:hypothetical protein